MNETFQFNLEKFIKDVNTLQEEHDVDYIDALLTVCDWWEIDLETITPILKKDAVIKEKLRVIAEEKNFLKKTKIET